MESLDSNYIVSIKDKNSVYFVKPFGDKNQKVVTFDKASTIIIKGEYIAVT
jgi:hypothetical protein